MIEGVLLDIVRVLAELLIIRQGIFGDRISAGGGEPGLWPNKSRLRVQDSTGCRKCCRAGSRYNKHSGSRQASENQKASR